MASPAHTATAPGTQRGTSSASHAAYVPVLSNFIGGMWVDARASGTVDVFNPATGAVIAKTPLSTRGDVDAAVAAAKAAFPAWRATPVAERARTMFAFKNRLEEHFEELARIVTTEHG
ncbi:MAG TPA: aldehyde dehydrogenase family protein, partial [Thermoanaerobaculia bacterium]|nr:aldehyde dehydrogenase family protein [Thermoanaerobaculia bacterium]